MAEYKLTRTDLLTHWKEQIDFLKSSMANFDKGIEGEAKRMATSLRLLFHQTSSSKALLKQLKFSMIFHSSGGLYTPSNLISSWTLLTMEIGPNGLYYRPRYESSRSFYLIFEDWWNEIIFDDKENVFTRRDIVLFVANKDGGAHVDPAIEEPDAQLVKHNSLGWVDESTGAPPLNNPAYQAIRIIANEVLESNDYFNKGTKKRYIKKGEKFEMRFVDEYKRYKWSETEITKSEETQKIVDQHKISARKLYVQEFFTGEKVEYIGR